MHSALLRATKKELTAPFVTLLVIRFNPYVVQGEGVCMLEPHLYVSSSFKLHFQELKFGHHHRFMKIRSVKADAV